MKKLIFVAIFSTVLFFMAASSQNEAVPRQYSPEEILTLQKGEIDNFKYQLFRFTTAVEEKDQENVDVMKSVLMQAIQAEITRNQKRRVTAAQSQPGLEKRLKAQQQLQKALATAPFDVREANFEKSVKDKAMFDDFIQLMEESRKTLQKQTSGQ
ncbi:MAG: hypothetical protein ACE5FF_00680 [Saprospiraceae bacterium]